MPSQITMPQLSDTMTEGTVVKWHKKEGDKVRAGETEHPKQEPERVQARKDQVSLGTHGHESLISSAVADRPGERGNGRTRISPLARRIAQDKGIDPAQIRGSGPGGRIVQRDVLTFIEQGGSPQRSAPTPAPSPSIAAGEK